VVRLPRFEELGARRRRPANGSATAGGHRASAGRRSRGDGGQRTSESGPPEPSAAALTGRARTLLAAVAAALAVTLPAAASGPHPRGQTFVIHVPTALQRRTLEVWCYLPAGQQYLPAATEYGLASHLRQYPDLSLATPSQLTAARSVFQQAKAAALPYARLAAARLAGYDLHLARKPPAVLGVLHAEKKWRRAGRDFFDPTKPKALIYARQPGRPLVLIGVMFSMPRGVLGPNTLGPIGRWHSHLICFRGDARGLAPPGRFCPAGEKLGQGSEMLHIWFTNDLRSAYAIHVPVRQLCRDGLLDADTCAKHPKPLGM
jgi:hypothetical protein